jgi:hypothetical protein
MVTGIVFTAAGAALAALGTGLVTSEDTIIPGVLTLGPAAGLLAFGIPFIAVGASSVPTYPEDNLRMRSPGMTGTGIGMITIGGVATLSVSGALLAEAGQDGSSDSEVWGLWGASLAALGGGIAMTVHGAREDEIGVQAMRSKAAVEAGIVCITLGSMAAVSMSFGLFADAMRERRVEDYTPDFYPGTPATLIGGLALVGVGLPLVLWGSGEPDVSEPVGPGPRFTPQWQLGPTSASARWAF